MKPFSATFIDLARALADLHLWNSADVSRLHDIWKLGAPTPNSIVRNPRNYDPRKAQVGNYEARIIWPQALVTWIVDVSARRGMPLDERQAINMLNGEADYGFDLNRND